MKYLLLIYLEEKTLQKGEIMSTKVFVNLPVKNLNGIEP